MSFNASYGVHGTKMATLICNICPLVSLYVAKLDNEVSNKAGSGIFTAKHAAEVCTDLPSPSETLSTDVLLKAVDWAIENEVHLISMSWSIIKSKENHACMV